VVGRKTNPHWNKPRGTKNILAHEEPNKKQAPPPGENHVHWGRAMEERRLRENRERGL
jgi:hypothetical protein